MHALAYNEYMNLKYKSYKYKLKYKLKENIEFPALPSKIT